MGESEPLAQAPPVPFIQASGFASKPCRGEGTRDRRRNHWGGNEEGGTQDANVKTMVEMTKPIHGTRKVVMGDSGFGVQDGVIACTKKGCYPETYAKKRGHWPRGVPGDHIDSHFADAENWDIARYLCKITRTRGSSCIAVGTVSMCPKSCRPTACLRRFRTIQPGGRLMAGGRRSSTIWSRFRGTTSGLSIGSMTTTIAGMILLGWRRFAGQNGGQCVSSLSCVWSQR
jgi:hypothetical protein